MCCMRFTISASYRKAVERRLKTAQRLGHVRQVKYLLAILAVVEGQNITPVAVVLHVPEKTVSPPGAANFLLWPPGCPTPAAHRAPAQTHADTESRTRPP
jgi:hypothetical protein